MATEHDVMERIAELERENERLKRKLALETAMADSSFTAAKIMFDAGDTRPVPPPSYIGFTF